MLPLFFYMLTILAIYLIIHITQTQYNTPEQETCTFITFISGHRDPEILRNAEERAAAIEMFDLDYPDMTVMQRVLDDKTTELYVDQTGELICSIKATGYMFCSGEIC